LTRGVKTKKG